jgi:Flp pilus assembly protein TadG
MSTHRRRPERGQVVPIAALLMIVLVGFAALILDGGRGYVDRRSLQSAADTSALSGANQLGSKLLGTNFTVDCAVAATFLQATRNLPGTQVPNTYRYNGNNCPTLNALFRYSASNVDLQNGYKMDIDANLQQVKVTLHHTLGLTFGVAARFGTSILPGATATAVNGAIPFALVLYRNNANGNGVGDPHSNLSFGGSSATLTVDTGGAAVGDALSNEGICPAPGTIDFSHTGDQYTFYSPGFPTGSCGDGTTNIVNQKIGGDPISFPVQLPDPRLQPPALSTSSCTLLSPCSLSNFTIPDVNKNPGEQCIDPGVYSQIELKKGTLILKPGVYEITGGSNAASSGFKVGNGATVTTLDNMDPTQLIAASGCPLSAPAAGTTPVSVIMDPKGANGDQNQLLVSGGGTFNIYSGRAFNNIALYVRESANNNPCDFNGGSVNNPSICGSQVINFGSGALYTINGTVYAYGDNVIISSAQTQVNAIGQTLAWTLTINGNGPLRQTYDPSKVPFLQGLYN